MATWTARRFAEVDRLKIMSQVQLRALLLPHAAYLESRGVMLPPIEDGEIDLVMLSGVLMNPDENMPPRLVDALYLINEMATDEGMDALVEAAQQSGRTLVAGASATPADVAVEVWLKWPDLLDRKHAENLITRPRSFEYFLGRADAPRKVPPDDFTRRAALEKQLDDWFDGNRRGRGCRVLRFDRDAKVWFLVRHGMPVKREGSMKDGKPDSVFYRPEKHDVVVYDTERDELGINASGRKEKKLYCQAFGDHLFGNVDHFPGENKYTLDPLKEDGANALVCSDVDGLEDVTLVELWFFYGGGYDDVEIRKASDVFAAMAARGRSISRMARLPRAVFSVKFASAPRPRRFTVRPPNITQYTRDEDSELVELWMLKRGFIRPLLMDSDANADKTMASA
jgi:hypothetical protein